MHSVDFCDACIEGLWRSLLSPLTLVEEVTQISHSETQTNVTLALLPLAELREIPRTTEAYTISWYDADGTEIEDWANKTSVLVEKDAGSLEVEVRFWTTQVRVDENGVLTYKGTIDLE